MIDRLRPLFPYLRRYWRTLAVGCLTLVLYNAAKSLLALIIGHAIDAARTGKPYILITHAVLELLALACCSAIFLYLMRQIIIGVSREIEFDLRNDLFAQLTLQPQSFFQRHRVGDIMARSTNDLNAVRQLLGPAIMYSLNTVVFTVAALPFMIRLSPKLTLFAFVPLPIASVAVQYFGARIHTRFERIQAMFSDISAQAEENFSGARLIRAFAQEDAQIAAFETSNREYIRRSLLLARLMAMLWPTLELVLGLSLVITVFVGGREVILHHMTAGNFASYLVYMVQLTWPMIAIGWVVNLVQRGTASVARIHALMVETPAIDDRDADITLADDPIAGTVEFRNLCFSYATGPEVLHDISLTIPAGSSLAITGPTGSGKTTLVSLIPRLHDAPVGDVLIDGRPIRDYPLENLRRNIGIVPQETFLFSSTIHDNIGFGVPGTTREQVNTAASIANIATEIGEFPLGFDTVVGERGMTLSGGQKQRTAIARAVLRDPRILILDDALASVDTQTEDRILTSLRNVMRGRTSILIAHRISTARSADRIAVLIEGRIAELGTHDELVARGGYYSELYSRQSLEEEILTA